MDRKIFLLMLPQELIWRGNIGRIDECLKDAVYKA